MRIVSLLPSATELLFAIGAGDDVVGVTFECDYPPQARDARVVSTSSLPPGLSPAEIDAAVAARLAAGEDLYRLRDNALRELDPDLVVTQDLCAVCAVDVSVVADALNYLSCQAEVVTLDPRRLHEVVDSVFTLGAATGRMDAAASVAANLNSRLSIVADAVAGRPLVPVLVLEWTDPPFSPGHWVPDMIEAAGGRSVLGDAGRVSRRVSWQAATEAGAEVLVTAPCGFDLADSVVLTKDLISAGHLPPGLPVWAVDANGCFARPGPRVINGVQALAALLHPEADLDLDPAVAQRVA